MGDGKPTGQFDRLGAIVAVVPFLAFALLSVVVIYRWAPDPRWALVVIPPFGFMIGLTWLAFGRDR